MEPVIGNPVVRDQVPMKIKGILLLNYTTTTRSKKLSGAVMSQLMQRVKVENCLSLAVDESTHLTDDAQLLVYLTYCLDRSDHEDILGLQTSTKLLLPF